MRTVFEGKMPVHYGQFYVEAGGGTPGMEECFAGQRNGLCGAAVPGHLFFVTGLHTGDVGLTVELHEQPPPLDETWEDIVEASFHPRAKAMLTQWAGEQSWDLGLTETDYRVRYSGKDMEAAQEEDTTLDDEPLIDHYLLQFWPAPPTPDIVVKQASSTAEYWHDFASQQPPRQA
ncbi:hypothetical protein GCM10022247_03870 [Allokutzneria multivorans]|uniref:Uncharacterized protein n=1 Tax=Allokutzneria multivorans TaxID=1142134 RepID=A0ABP7QV93_9PSEU